MEYGRCKIAEKKRRNIQKRRTARTIYGKEIIQIVG